MLIGVSITCLKRSKCLFCHYECAILHDGNLTQFLKKRRILLAARSQLLLRKLERVLGLALPDELNQSLLL